MVKVREYDLPSSQTLSAIVFENGTKSKMDYDVIIELKGGTPQMINKLHPSYIPLQFPLLFIYNPPGFRRDMKLKSVSTSGEKEEVVDEHVSYVLVT